MSKLEEVSHKTRDFFGGRGGGPSLLRRGEKRRSAMPRPGGPWPDWGWWVGVAGRLFVVWGHILELCWHILGAMLPQLEVMSAHVGAMLAHLGAMLAHLGAMMAHLGAILAHLGRYVGPSWGYVGPSCGLCWPMLTHLEPQDPKNGKKSEEHKTP